LPALGHQNVLDRPRRLERLSNGMNPSQFVHGLTV